jgi:hypothetical protein
LLALAYAVPAEAQWQSDKSVLSENTWCKIGVTEDGVYAIDYATLQALGINVGSLNPRRIRLFGNAPGMLPEENASPRFDDLSEIPIQVTGASDGSFDPEDQVLFYGKGPVNMVLKPQDYYAYVPNLYTDTAFYFLCVDGTKAGLRIQENPQAVGSDARVIDSYLDYCYHESEELSPYASGRIWYGDLFTGQEGSKEFIFEVPDLVKTMQCHIESNVLGRCKTPFSYNLSVNGNVIVNHYVIPKYGDYDYGKEHKSSRDFFSDSETLLVHYDLDSCTDNPMLFIDYFVLNYWRKLRFYGGEMAFRIIPSQTFAMEARVRLEGVGSDAVCWDVTNPVYPYLQPLEYEAGGALFGISGDVERRFHLVDPSGVKAVASCRRIPNQNLHGITSADLMVVDSVPDTVLLIITPRLFWSQSEELAEFHRERDSMICVLADVQEIYNEFGTGAQDPTAVRDFIRMVYLRSNGNLKYVLFMGKGTHDYRDIKGAHNNFVPTYETASGTVHEVESMCSDDYFGLMDLNDGLNCTGRVDLGLGRIPITTPEQGDAVVAKIKHYADLASSHGIWKNNHLFMADNDSKTYADHADKLDYMLDTSWRVAMTKKLYIDSYRIISTPAGKRIPEANAKLMDYFDKGISVLSYTGHGGVKSLSSEWVLGISDILALDNYDRMPFVHTATCEFSKFDNPTVVSAGELLFLNAQGGAIAMLTTMRSTLAPNNLLLSKSLHDHLYDKVDHQPLRFGDIYRRAKSDLNYYKKDNIVYVLFGDPALRFSYPARMIRTTKINGIQVSEDTLSTIDTGLGSIEGYVAGLNDEIDARFNGVVEVRVYDIKSNYTTLGNFGTNYHYSFYNDVLFEGRASVVNGRFSLQFPIPEDISQGSGLARVSYYAYDSIRNVDANGVFENLEIKAADVVDNQGPDIKLYWNSPDFESGDTVLRKGVLYADLYDEHGIYYYNVSIGRDIVLKSNVSGCENMVLNDRYEPALDDYQRGRVALPIDELEDGTYEFMLKAWDTRNNSSEVEISFIVREGAIMAQMRNYPNPFTDETWFVFNHGDMTDRLSIAIDIYDVMGRQVASIQKETQSEVGVVPPIRWDGSTLRPGLYVYRITVTNSQGKTVSLCQRMVKK